jgi:hypothetical protein
MNKKLLLITLSFMSFQICNSQPSLVTVSIKPDSSVTSGTVLFHCTINNPTKKKYRYFDFDPTCKQHYAPEFWKIVIRKDTTEYIDCSLEFVMRQRIKDPEVKLCKNSIRTFEFCLNFKKLLPGSDILDFNKLIKPKTDYRQWIKDYNNEMFGGYEVQIFYLKDPFDAKNPLLLISNWTNVEYVHK